MNHSLNFPLVNQVLHLEEEKASLKQSSEQEVGELWTQLESMRTSRRELGGETSSVDLNSQLKLRLAYLFKG